MGEAPPQAEDVEQALGYLRAISPTRPGTSATRSKAPTSAKTAGQPTCPLTGTTRLPPSARNVTSRYAWPAGSRWSGRTCACPPARWRTRGERVDVGRGCLAAAGCGVSDAEDRARQAAEAWVSANLHGTAVLGTARPDDGPTTLSAHWVSTGRARRSRGLRDGRITWARIPVPRPGAGG